MILYLDTSCLAKLYLEEAGTEIVKGAAGVAEFIATSMVAEAELRSALARRRREADLTGADFRNIKEKFFREWKDFFRISLTEEISGHAGDLAEKYGLRGFDAIHLASALFLRSGLAKDSIRFYCADLKLNSAARKEGFHDLFE